MRRGRNITRSRNTVRYAPYEPHDGRSRRRQHQKSTRHQQDLRRKQQGSSIQQQGSPSQQQEFQRQQLPDAMTDWIDPRLGSESQRMDLAAVLVKIIVGLRGETTLHCLENELFQERNWKFADRENGLRDFIEDFQHVFKLHNNGDLGQDTISCNPVLDICPTHISNPGRCQGNCEAFHVCKFYLLSRCDIENCKFGHNLKSDPHNMKVSEKRLVNELSLYDIRGVFRKLSNRHGPTIPSVCTYFNAKGCKMNPCPFLHICQHYIDGDCKFDDLCKRSHNMHSDQPRQLLMKYGLQNERFDQLLKLIQGEKTITRVSTSKPNIKSKYCRENLFRGSKIQSRKGMFVNGPNNGTVNCWLKSQDEVANPQHDDMEPNSIKKDDSITVNNIFNGDTNKLSLNVPTKESSDENSTSSDSNTCSNFENKCGEKKLRNSQLPEKGSNNDNDVGSSVLQTLQSMKDETVEVALNLDNSKRNEEKNGISHGEIHSQSTCGNYETTFWQFTEDGNTNENDIPASERKTIEQKYQKYLVAKEQYITIDNTVYKIDFSTMEGIPYEEDKARITLTRCVRNVQT